MSRVVIYCRSAVAGGSFELEQLAACRDYAAKLDRIGRTVSRVAEVMRRVDVISATEGLEDFPEFLATLGGAAQGC